MKSQHYGAKLLAARNRLHRTPDEMAKLLDIPVAAYYDLEAFDDELTTSLSMRQVAQLFNTLGVEPTTFFETDPTEALSSDGFVTKINEYLKTRQITIAEFEDQVGWDIDPLLKDPSRLLSYNVDGLRDISSGIGVHWLSVLQGIISDHNRQ